MNSATVKITHWIISECLLSLATQSSRLETFEGRIGLAWNSQIVMLKQSTVKPYWDIWSSASLRIHKACILDIVFCLPNRAEWNTLLRETIHVSPHPNS